ncbi:hypothetical protein Tco_0610695 [Tanacetum coccineum]
MSNSNTNLQTQSSNALHNAIMEAGSKDRPPMLAPVPVAEVVLKQLLRGIESDAEDSWKKPWLPLLLYFRIMKTATVTEDEEMYRKRRLT